MENKVCRFCFNARVESKIPKQYEDPRDEYLDTPLTDENDFRSCGLKQVNFPNNERYSLMLSAGSGRPVRLEVNSWQEVKHIPHWTTVLTYYPKFCPECGRDLSEDNYDNIN